MTLAEGQRKTIRASSINRERYFDIKTQNQSQKYKVSSLFYQNNLYQNIEAKAFGVGLQFTKNVELQELNLEGNSPNVYSVLARLPPSPAVVAPVYGILDSCQEVCYVRFAHVPRKGNRLAHLLAKHAIDIVSYLIWMEESPYFLEQALHHDVVFC